MRAVFADFVERSYDDTFEQVARAVGARSSRRRVELAVVGP